MTIKKKIILSNIIMVMIPVIIALTVWGIHNANNSDITSGDTLVSSQSIVYTFEEQAMLINWTELTDINRSDIDDIPTEQEQIISELSDMGYHLFVENDGKILFTNFDETDAKAVQTVSFSKGYAEYGDTLVICDKAGGCSITAVYKKSRADKGTINSTLPLYTISESEILILLLTSAFVVIIVSLLLSSWLESSVLNPLNILKSGSERIANGDTDFSVEYNQSDEFGIVCKEFDKMRSRLRKADQERVLSEQYRRELLNGISHDLRSPLTSIKGYTEGLRDGIADTPDKRERYYRAILTRADDLERLTDSLSSLVKLENPDYPYHLKRTDITEFISHFIEENTVYSEQNQVMITFSHKEKMFVDIDHREMNRVLYNLLENSVKHRCDNSTTIGITVCRIGEEIEINFKDNGSGVPEKHLDRIFDSFYRGDESRTKPENGSGLGLAIVRRTIEGHGGTVKAYTENGLGIRIILPVSKGSEHE